MRIGPLGIWELLIILVVVLLIFGPRRLPEMAKGLGQSVREFRKGIRDMKNDFEAEAGAPESAPREPESTPKPSVSSGPKAPPTDATVAPDVVEDKQAEKKSV